MLWTEKYRPHEWEDFVNVYLEDGSKGLDDLRGYVLSGLKNSPNLLFYGEYGTGKTSFAEFYAREMHARFVELNGPDVNKRDVNDFVKQREVAHNMSEFDVYEDGTRLPGIVYAINESDVIKHDAQIALRMAVEKQLGALRFIFITNVPGEMDKGLMHRLSKFEFRNLEYGQARDLILRILRDNGKSLSEEMIQDIYKKTQNPREIVMKLQKLYNRSLPKLKK